MVPNANLIAKVFQSDNGMLIKALIHLLAILRDVFILWNFF